MQLDPRVPVGHTWLIDADIGLMQPADGTRPLQRKATSMVNAAHTPQHHTLVALVVGGDVGKPPGQSVTDGDPDQYDFDPVEMYGIARTQHRHSLYWAAVHMHPAHTFGNIQPDAAAIYAELHQRRMRWLDQGDAPIMIGVPAHPMHAHADRDVRMLVLGKSQAEVIHLVSMLQRACLARHSVIPTMDHIPKPMDAPMTGIDIKHAHSLPKAKARKAVEEVAAKLAQRFDVHCEWDEDTLKFTRSGVDGKIALKPKELRVTAKLGFLLSAMKAPIEAEIRRVLDERFK